MCFRPATIDIDLICPKCGEKASQGDKVCSGCGSNLPEAVFPGSQGILNAPGVPAAPGKPVTPRIPSAPKTPIKQEE